MGGGSGRIVAVLLFLLGTGLVAWLIYKVASERVDMAIRERQYYDLLRSVPEYKGRKYFQTSGKLIIALFEFRPLPEIRSVVNALLRIYSPQEIGLAIVHGTQNERFVREMFQDWRNVLLINTGDFNHDGNTYSQRLQTPELWERFVAFDFVLVTQCDALLLKQIPSEYYNYDYVGAPWANPPLSHLGGGNGGFSLRRVSAMIKACEPNRRKKLQDIDLPHGHEDVFFSMQPHMRYPRDKTLHRAFASETIFSPDPVGLHKCYAWIDEREQWNHILENIKAKLLIDNENNNDSLRQQ